MFPKRKLLEEHSPAKDRGGGAYPLAVEVMGGLSCICPSLLFSGG